MKAANSPVIMLILIVVTSMMMNCREITTTTKLLPEGSVERTVQVKSSHATHEDSYFPIPTDSAWSVSNMKLKSDSSQYEYTASRAFSDVESMQSVYSRYKDSGAVEITINLEKRYGLFFRYYRYEEVYRAYTPYTRVSVGEYLTEEEIQTYLAHPDSSALEEKVDEWRTHAIFEEFYQGILTKAQSLEIPAMNNEQFNANKDTLLSVIIESSDSTDDVLAALSSVLNTDAVYALRDTVKALLQTIKEDFDIIMQAGVNDYVNQVIMPGLLLDANADAVEGNMAQWDFPGEVFEFRDKNMWVESRVIHWWGIGASLGILILMGFLLILVRVRTK